MKVAHFAQFAPNACGLYHTAKELVQAERLIGIDARFINFYEKYGGIKQDGNFKTEDIKWAYSTDILVRHSAIPTHLQCAGIPIVMAMHGRPESSFRIEQQKNNPIITAFVSKVQDCRYKAFITFWPEYIDIWSKMIPKEKLFYVPATVDLEEFQLIKKSHEGCNILIADLWREDVTPFNMIFAAGKFAKKYNAKVNIVGLGNDCIKAVAPFLSGLKKDGVLGSVAAQMRDMPKYYAAADIVVTPHVIATRIIREALSSGVPVVAGSGCKYTPYTANPMDINNFAKAIERCWEDKEQQPRKISEKEFNFEQAGKAAKKVFDKILQTKTGKRKIFIDIGGHLGETVRRFYREVPDADEYEIYSFEPDFETFKKLDANVGHIKNVNLINAMMGTRDGIVDFFVGRDNQNEGGTSIRGKQTGKVNYEKPIKVESINLARWLKSNVDGDYVILKMNIEGGEYDLMEMMLDEDLLVDKCFIQLHAHKFEHGEQRQRFQRIEAKFYNKAKCKKYLTNKGFHKF